MLWGMAQLWVRVEAEAWPFVVIVGCKWHRGDIVAGAGGHAGQGECVHAQGGTFCDLDDDIGTIRTGGIGGTMEELVAGTFAWTSEWLNVLRQFIVLKHFVILRRELSRCDWAYDLKKHSQKAEAGKEVDERVLGCL